MPPEGEPYTLCNLAMLNGDFRAVSELEYHRAVSTNCDGINDRQPQLFIKLGNSERPTLNVLYKALDDFRLAEPLPLGGFQLVNTLRRCTVAFEIGIISICPLGLVNSGSGIFLDALARQLRVTFSEIERLSSWARLDIAVLPSKRVLYSVLEYKFQYAVVGDADPRDLGSKNAGIVFWKS